MQSPGVAVVVTEAAETRHAITLVLESEGWVVLPLEDGVELFDFVEFISENPLRMGAPRLVVTEVDLPGPSVYDTIAWARLRGLDLPFVLLTRDDDDAKERARSLGAVEVRELHAA